MSSSDFPREERVRRRLEFDRAYTSGARIRTRYMTVFVVANGGTVARLGVAATRKLGSAVERNRVKRLSREIFRRHKGVSGLDIVIVPRREMLDAPFSSLEADYVAALRRRGQAPSDARRPDRGKRGKAAHRRL